MENVNMDTTVIFHPYTQFSGTDVQTVWEEEEQVPGAIGNKSCWRRTPSANVNKV